MQAWEVAGFRLPSPANDAWVVQTPVWTAASGSYFAVQAPFTFVVTVRLPVGAPGWLKLSVTWDPFTAGSNLPATSIGFPGETLDGQVSIVSVEPAWGLVKTGAGFGIGVGVGKEPAGRIGTRRGNLNVEGVRVSEAGIRPCTPAALWKRASAFDISRPNRVISLELLSRRTGRAAAS